MPDGVQYYVGADSALYWDHVAGYPCPPDDHILQDDQRYPAHVTRTTVNQLIYNRHLSKLGTTEGATCPTYTGRHPETAEFSVRQYYQNTAKTNDLLKQDLTSQQRNGYHGFPINLPPYLYAGSDNLAFTHKRVHPGRKGRKSHSFHVKSWSKSKGRSWTKGKGKSLFKATSGQSGWFGFIKNHSNPRQLEAEDMKHFIYGYGNYGQNNGNYGNNNGIYGNNNTIISNYGKYNENKTAGVNNGSGSYYGNNVTQNYHGNQQENNSRTMGNTNAPVYVSDVKKATTNISGNIAYDVPQHILAMSNINQKQSSLKKQHLPIVTINNHSHESIYGQNNENIYGNHTQNNGNIYGNNTQSNGNIYGIASQTSGNIYGNTSENNGTVYGQNNGNIYGNCLNNNGGIYGNTVQSNISVPGKTISSTLVYETGCAENADVQDNRQGNSQGYHSNNLGYHSNSQGFHINSQGYHSNSLEYHANSQDKNIIYRDKQSNNRHVETSLIYHRNTQDIDTQYRVNQALYGNNETGYHNNSNQGHVVTVAGKSNTLYTYNNSAFESDYQQDNASNNGPNKGTYNNGPNKGGYNGTKKCGYNNGTNKGGYNNGPIKGIYNGPNKGVNNNGPNQGNYNNGPNKGGYNNGTNKGGYNNQPIDSGLIYSNALTNDTYSNGPNSGTHTTLPDTGAYSKDDRNAHQEGQTVTNMPLCKQPATNEANISPQKSIAIVGPQTRHGESSVEKVNNYLRQYYWDPTDTSRQFESTENQDEYSASQEQYPASQEQYSASHKQYSATQEPYPASQEQYSASQYYDVNTQQMPFTTEPHVPVQSRTTTGIYSIENRAHVTPSGSLKVKKHKRGILVLPPIQLRKRITPVKCSDPISTTQVDQPNVQCATNTKPTLVTPGVQNIKPMIMAPSGQNNNTYHTGVRELQRELQTTSFGYNSVCVDDIKEGSDEMCVMQNSLSQCGILTQDGTITQCSQVQIVMNAENKPNPVTLIL